MSLGQLIQINISRNTQAISQPGFGIPMILGSSKTAPGMGSYSNLPAVLAEPGITTSSEEYKAAARLFGQSPKPSIVKIGKALAKVAQVVTITPTAVNSTAYVVTLSGKLNGVTFNLIYTYTSDSSALVTEIVSGLITLINADSAANGVTATGSTTLILTSNSAGLPFSVVLGDHMVQVLTTANTGVVESLAALSLNYDDDWYGLISTFRSVSDAIQIADYTQGVQKLFGVSTNSASAYDPTSTTDLAYLIKNGAYDKTWCMYSADFPNYPEAGEFGKGLPLTPGSETWAYKTIAGTPADTISDGQINALKAKNCNYYTEFGNQNIFMDGKVGSGEWIDIIRLIAKLESDMMTAVFGTLVNSPKIPFTNPGITLIQGKISGVLKANQKTGGVAPDDVDDQGNLVPGYSTSFPNVFDISSNDRANRLLSGGTFTARLAGAIQYVTINGSVTV